MADEAKKIIVDEDWKAQAQKEKEQLAEKDAKSTDADAVNGQTRELPNADMTGLISMLATQAFLSLGAFGGEGGQEPQIELDMAKYSIDMLAVIEEKTKGNLTQQEAGTLDGTLHQLRMAYVNVSKQVNEKQ
jgi:hypothetical protein